jgi:hypothetical protein
MKPLGFAIAVDLSSENAESVSGRPHPLAASCAATVIMPFRGRDRSVARCDRS